MHQSPSLARFNNTGTGYEWRICDGFCNMEQTRSFLRLVRELTREYTYLTKFNTREIYYNMYLSLFTTAFGISCCCHSYPVTWCRGRERGQSQQEHLTMVHQGWPDPAIALPAQGHSTTPRHSTNLSTPHHIVATE